MGHAPLYLDAQIGDVRELDGVVLATEDRAAEVFADLVGVDVEGGRELDVGDVVAAEIDVHQPRYGLGGVGIAVVLDALDQRRGAVTDADDGDADLAVRAFMSVLRGRFGHGQTSDGGFARDLRTKSTRCHTVKAVRAASRYMA